MVLHAVVRAAGSSSWMVGIGRGLADPRGLGGRRRDGLNDWAHGEEAGKVLKRLGGHAAQAELAGVEAR